MKVDLYDGLAGTISAPRPEEKKTKTEKNSQDPQPKIENTTPSKEG